MIIVVTGGAGFIGSNFLHYIIKTHPSYRIVCMDNLTYACTLTSISDLMNSPNFRFVKSDICDKRAVEKIFKEENPDIIVNFAAESHVNRSIENPLIFSMTNIIGTQTLMNACLKYGIKRFHQVSTDEVYGDLPIDRLEPAFTENSSLKPSSPYSASKAAADLMVLAYYRTFNLPITISRCSNNYGPWQHPEKLIPLTIINAIQGKCIPVYGKGINVRDWIYVEDHCRAIDFIIHSGINGEIYNIAGHNEINNIDVVKTICNELSKSDELITYVSDRKGHDMRYSINTDKIQKELGWRSNIEFENGIKKTILWYNNNKKWLEEILSKL